MFVVSKNNAYKASQNKQVEPLGEPEATIPLVKIKSE
jgi:hypothetical protein